MSDSDNNRPGCSIGCGCLPLLITILTTIFCVRVCQNTCDNDVTLWEGTVQTAKEYWSKADTIWNEKDVKEEKGDSVVFVDSEN